MPIIATNSPSSIFKETSLSALKDVSPVEYVFIEFCYSSGVKKYKIKNLAINIHDNTLKIIEDILDKTDSSDSMYIYRMEVLDDITISNSNKLNEIKLDNCKIKFNEWNFKEYKIPRLTKSKTFLMDEFLFIETEKLNFCIQIEHSEGYKKHKSNMLEFILRILNKLNVKTEDVKIFLEKKLKINFTGDKLIYDTIGGEKITKESVYRDANEKFFDKYIL